MGIHTSHQNDNRWTPMPPTNNDEYSHVPSNTLVKKHGYYSSYKPVKEIENTDTLQALEDILNQTNSGPVEDLLDIEVSEILESELNTTSSDDDITSILAEVLIPSRVNLTNEETQVIQNEEDETEELAVDFLNEILLTAINKRRRKTRV